MTNEALEQRLATLERTVAELQRRIEGKNWVERLIGSVTDEEAFLEAMRLGREFRDSDRPTDPFDDQP
jgi:hypothetical protein